jgi:hypothetical protein
MSGATLFVGTNKGAQIPWFGYALVFLFLAAGLLILYTGLSLKHRSHRLLIGDGKLRHATRLGGREKLRIYPISDIKSVRQAEFYTQNYEPVYGIEIEVADRRRIRFGTQLMEDEKRWLVWEIRNALRSQGNQTVVPGTTAAA